MHRFLCHSLRFYTSISGLLSIPRKKVLRVCNNHFFSAKWQRHKTETRSNSMQRVLNSALCKQLLTWFLASFRRFFFLLLVLALFREMTLTALSAVGYPK